MSCSTRSARRRRWRSSRTGPGSRTCKRPPNSPRRSDGFLALEQAAAYIEENRTSLAAYLELFRKHQGRILHEGEVLGYQMTVATTWEVSLHRVEEVSPEAVDLLRLCAFLAADDIPHQLIVDGAEALPERLASRVADPLGLNATVAVLRAHSWCGPTGNRCPCTVWSRP